MHGRSDSVTTELNVDGKAGFTKNRPDGVGDIADLVARTCRGDTRGQRSFGGIDHRQALCRLVLADDETDGRVRCHAAEDHGKIEGQQIAVGQVVVVRQTVQHSVVDRRADVVAERSAPEGRRVIDVARRRPRPEDDVLGPFVDLEQVGADGRAFADGLENFGDECTGFTGKGNLARGQDFDHGMPFGSMRITIPV